jgi:hypothetical protein
MHVQNHAIAFIPIDNRRNDNQRILSHEIPDASLPLLVPLAERFHVEFQRVHAREQQQKAAQRVQQRVSVRHPARIVVWRTCRVAGC